MDLTGRQIGIFSQKSPITSQTRKAIELPVDFHTVWNAYDKL
jgi:hypothetical protein